MAHKVAIDKKEYSSCIIDRFEQMQKDDRHCNFIIKVGSEEIQAHRNMLCAASDYFDAMLSHDTKENRSGVVEMIDVDPECMKICVNHIYGREVSVPPEKYEQLMYVANLMQLQMLRDGVLTLLGEKLDLKSFFMARRIADLLGCKNLKAKCVEFAKENLHLISKEKEFRNLEKNYIAKVMKSGQIKMIEEEKLDALLRWVDCDSERSKLLTEMLNFINFEKLSIEMHEYVIKNSPLISGNLELFKIFTSSMMNIFKSVGKTSVVLFDKFSGHILSFDPRGGSLRKIQQLNEAMMEHGFSAVSLDNQIYVLMWDGSVYRFGCLEKIASWEQMATMIADHGWHPPAVTFSGCVYVVGGSHIWSAEKYDPASNMWTALSIKSQCANNSGILASHGYIYCIGGIDQYGSHVKSFQRLHLSSLQWQDLPAMNEKRAFAGVVELDGKIYVMGGSNTEELRSVERYDLATNQWAISRPMKNPRSRFRCFAVNGCIYTIGTGNSNTTEKYHVKKDEWEIVDQLSGKNFTISDSVIVSL